MSYRLALTVGEPSGIGPDLTVELAQQIHGQAKRLTVHLRTENGTNVVHAQAMYGGVPKFVDLQRLQCQIPTILTATPGRLLDHIKSTNLGHLPAAAPTRLDDSSTQLADNPEGIDNQESAMELEEKDTGDAMSEIPFRNLLSDVQILVLDEMDSLLGPTMSIITDGSIAGSSNVHNHVYT